MKVIEFMGMPRTGKSTQFQLVETVLRYQEHKKVRCLYEAVKACPLERDNRFIYNSWSFHHTVNKLMEARGGDTDFVLVERGVWDHIAFSSALYLNGKITEEQSAAQSKYCEQFGFLEDKVFVFMVDPETSVKREQKHHRLQGVVINMDFLSCLHKAYEKTIDGIKQNYQVIDSAKPFEENTEEILDYILG